MNWKTIGILLLGYHLFKEFGTQVANRLSMGKPRLKFGNIRPQGINATLILPVTNSNPANLPVESFQGQVLYGQFPLSDVYLDSPQVLQSDSTTELKFNILIDTSRFSGSVIDIVNSGQLLQSLRLKGFLKSGGIVFPIDRTLQLLTL